MEDNIGDFFENVPKRLSKYLSELPDDWGILYDSVWGDYREMNELEVIKDKLTYLKSHNVTKNKKEDYKQEVQQEQTQFYFLNYDTAKKMEQLFIPFNHSADIWMNEVLRRGNINSFWSEPSLINLNKQTSTLVDKNKILYRVKSR